MNEKYLYGIIGLLAGIIIAGVFASTAVNGQHAGMMRMMGMNNTGSQMRMMSQDSDDYDSHHPTGSMSNTMQGMMNGLENKTGDDFDKAFISEMIVHHQGAIDMANAALKNAKHQEIKDLANAIISAQTKEINQMKEWQTNWYK
jgi:uncharacterized protein (DUF305 family)